MKPDPKLSDLLRASLLLVLWSCPACDRALDLNNPFDPNVPLKAPSDLKLISLAEDALSIQWKDNTQIVNEDQDANARIIVEQSLDGTNFLAMDSLSAASRAGTVTRCYQLNTTYYFRVHKRVGSRTTTSSNIVNGVAAFSSPRNFKVDSLSESRRRFTWQWQKISEPAAGFRLERRSGGGSTYATVGQATADRLSFVDTTIIRTDTVYFYRICAVTNGGTPSLFDSLSLSIPFPAPANLTCSGTSPDSVLLQWVTSFPYPATSIIERSTSGSEFVVLAGLPFGVNTFIDTSVDKYRNFQYRITSKSSYNVSPTSKVLRCGFQITDAPLSRIIKTPISPGTGACGLLSDDGALFLSVGVREVAIMDFTNGAYLRTVKFSKELGIVNAVALSRNKEVFAVVGYHDSIALLYRTADGSGICAFRGPWPGIDAALSDDGSQVMTSFGDGQLQCRRLADTALVWSKSLPGGSTSLWLHPDGKRLLAGNGAGTYVLDAETGAILSVSAGGNFGRTPGFSPAGDILVIVGNTCYNVTQNKIEFTDPNFKNSYWISADMLFVGFAEYSHTSGLVNMATRKAIFPFNSLFGWHQYIRMIDRDHKLLVYNQEGEIDVWDLRYNWSTY